MHETKLHVPPITTHYRAPPFFNYRQLSKSFYRFFFIEIFFESKIIYYEDLNIEKFNHFIYILNERDYN